MRPSKELVHHSDYALLKEQLENSERKVQALIASNDDMRSELAKLQSTVEKLVQVVIFDTRTVIGGYFSIKLKYSLLG